MNTRFLKKRILIPGIALLLAFAGLILYLNKTAILLLLEGKPEIQVQIEVISDGVERVSVEDLSKIGTIDQSLMLINTVYRLEEDFEPDLGEYRTSGVTMNTAIHVPYGELSDHIRETFGEKLYVSSSYRTREEQAALYEKDPTTATEPGASEHESGLSLDVYVAYYAGDGFLDSEIGRYVNTNAYRFGFIIRYPKWGEAQTGIRFEPWHIRYVGHPHAQIMTEKRLTLEEYIEFLVPGRLYEVTVEGETYHVVRSAVTDGMIEVPSGEGETVISPDNTGGYIVTKKTG